MKEPNDSSYTPIMTGSELVRAINNTLLKLNYLMQKGAEEHGFVIVCDAMAVEVEKYKSVWPNIDVQVLKRVEPA